MADYDFITIDFETANKNNNSACSLGIAFIKGCEVIDTKYYLIKPPGNSFHEENIRIHKLTPLDVENAPYFDAVWDQIKDFFDGRCIVFARNVQFDLSVLWCCLSFFDLKLPDFPYLDSSSVTTKVMGYGSGSSLKECAIYFGVKMQNHHNALDDSIVCAKIIIEAMKKCNSQSIQAFLEQYKTVLPKYFRELIPNQYFGQKSPSRFSRSTEYGKGGTSPQNYSRYKNAVPKISEISATIDEIDQSHELYNKNIVLTGELSGMGRKDAMQEIVNCGGILKSSVTSKTDYLIAGTQDLSIVGAGGISSKEEKANELIAKGYHIKILREEEFFRMIGRD